MLTIKQDVLFIELVAGYEYESNTVNTGDILEFNL